MINYEDECVVVVVKVKSREIVWIVDFRLLSGFLRDLCDFGCLAKKSRVAGNQKIFLCTFQEIAYLFNSNPQHRLRPNRQLSKKCISTGTRRQLGKRI